MEIGPLDSPVTLVVESTHVIVLLDHARWLLATGVATRPGTIALACTRDSRASVTTVARLGSGIALNAGTYTIVPSTSADRIAPAEAARSVPTPVTIGAASTVGVGSRVRTLARVPLTLSSSAGTETILACGCTNRIANACASRIAARPLSV